jgi:hypothetical protein
MAIRYEYLNGSPSAYSSTYGVEWTGMTFKPTVSHYITSVRISGIRQGSPGIITGSIRATVWSGTAYIPTGADLGSGTANGDTLGIAISEWRDINISGTPLLTAGVTYAIVIRCPTGTSINRYRWDFAGGGYANGTTVYSSDSGVGWVEGAGFDCIFEEWGITTPIYNQIVTGLRHIYNRKQDDLEITFGGYSTAEDILAPKIMKMVDDVTIPQITEPPKVPPVKPFEFGGGESGGSGATRKW